MERAITLWGGAPEVDGICKMSLSEIQNLHPALKKVPVKILASIVKNRDDIECIKATDEQFKKFICETVDDRAVEARWVENLIYSCKQW